MKIKRQIMKLWILRWYNIYNIYIIIIKNSFFQLDQCYNYILWNVHLFLIWIFVKISQLELEDVK